MITIVFHGDLQRFGRRFDLHAATPAEALRALFLQICGKPANFVQVQACF